MAKTKEIIRAAAAVLTGDPVERAHAEIARLEQVRQRIELERLQARDEIVALRGQLPAVELAEALDEQAVDAINAEQIVVLIQQSEAVIAKCDRLEPGVVAKIGEAQADLAEAQACEIDKRAEKVEKQRAEHMGKLSALLRQVSELEGDYVPRSSYQRAVIDLMARSGNGNTIPADMGAIVIPRSELLAAEAQALRQQAAELRRQATVPAHGQVSGYSLQELLEALKSRPMAPTEASVRAWFASTQERATKIEQDWARLQGSTPMRLVWLLRWSSGVVDLRASCVSAEEQRTWRHGPLSERAVGGHAYSTS